MSSSEENGFDSSTNTSCDPVLDDNCLNLNLQHSNSKANPLTLEDGMGNSQGSGKEKETGNDPATPVAKEPKSPKTQKKEKQGKTQTASSPKQRRSPKIPKKERNKHDSKKQDQGPSDIEINERQYDNDDAGSSDAIQQAETADGACHRTQEAADESHYSTPVQSECFPALCCASGGSVKHTDNTPISRDTSVKDHSATERNENMCETARDISDDSYRKETEETHDCDVGYSVVPGKQMPISEPVIEPRSSDSQRTTRAPSGASYMSSDDDAPVDVQRALARLDALGKSIEKSILENMPVLPTNSDNSVFGVSPETPLRKVSNMPVLPNNSDNTGFGVSSETPLEDVSSDTQCVVEQSDHVTMEDLAVNENDVKLSHGNHTLVNEGADNAVSYDLCSATGFTPAYEGMRASLTAETNDNDANEKLAAACSHNYVNSPETYPKVIMEDNVNTQERQSYSIGDVSIEGCLSRESETASSVPVENKTDIINTAHTIDKENSSDPTLCNKAPSFMQVEDGICISFTDEKSYGISIDNECNGDALDAKTATTVISNGLAPDRSQNAREAVSEGIVSSPASELEHVPPPSPLTMDTLGEVNEDDSTDEDSLVIRQSRDIDEFNDTICQRLSWLLETGMGDGEEFPESDEIVDETVDLTSESSIAVNDSLTTKVPFDISTPVLELHSNEEGSALSDDSLEVPENSNCTGKVNDFKEDSFSNKDIKVDEHSDALAEEEKLNEIDNGRIASVLDMVNNNLETSECELDYTATPQEHVDNIDLNGSVAIHTEDLHSESGAAAEVPDVSSECRGQKRKCLDGDDECRSYQEAQSTTPHPHQSDSGTGKQYLPVTLEHSFAGNMSSHAATTTIADHEGHAHDADEAETDLDKIQGLDISVMLGSEKPDIAVSVEAIIESGDPEPHTGNDSDSVAELSPHNAEDVNASQGPPCVIATDEPHTSTDATTDDVKSHKIDLSVNIPEDGFSTETTLTPTCVPDFDEVDRYSDSSSLSSGYDEGKTDTLKPKRESEIICDVIDAYTGYISDEEGQQSSSQLSSSNGSASDETPSTTKIALRPENLSLDKSVHIPGIEDTMPELSAVRNILCDLEDATPIAEELIEEACLEEAVSLPPPPQAGHRRSITCTESDIEGSEQRDDVSTGDSMYADDEDEGTEVLFSRTYIEPKAGSEVLVSCTVVNSSYHEADSDDFWGDGSGAEETFKILESSADAASSAFVNARIQMQDIHYHLQNLRMQMEQLHEELEHTTVAPAFPAESSLETGDRKGITD